MKIKQAEKLKSCKMKEEQTNKQTDICDCRVSFVTEKCHY